MRKSKVHVSPVAKSIPFDNDTNDFVSDDAQDAIEEARDVASSASRGPTVCGFDGNANVGRWLEFYSNNPSNNNPFIVAEASELVAVSIVTSSSSTTGTVTIYLNSSPIQTISLAAQKKNSIKGLAHLFTDLDELSVQVTSGSIQRPNIFMFIRTLP